MYSDPLFIKTVNEMIDKTISESNLPPENTLDLILFNTTTIAQEVTRINKNTKEGALTLWRRLTCNHVIPNIVWEAESRQNVNNVNPY